MVPPVVVTLHREEGRARRMRADGFLVRSLCSAWLRRQQEGPVVRRGRSAAGLLSRNPLDGSTVIKRRKQERAANVPARALDSTSVS